MLNECDLFYYFFNVLFIYLRETEIATEIVRENTREKQAPGWAEAQHGTWSQDLGIMTWAEGKCFTDWAPQVHPYASFAQKIRYVCTCLHPFFLTWNGTHEKTRNGTYAFFTLFWNQFVSVLSALTLSLSVPTAYYYIVFHSFLKDYLGSFYNFPVEHNAAISNLRQGAWVAQWVKCLPSAQVMIPRSWDWAPHRALCLVGSLLLPLPLPTAHARSLSNK